VQCNSYAITIKLTCRLNNKCYHITNIYGPSNSSQKQGFITWLMNLDTSSFEDWALGGDFNLFRNPENRNKPGGDIREMCMFNEMITIWTLLKSLSVEETLLGATCSQILSWSNWIGCSLLAAGPSPSQQLLFNLYPSLFLITSPLCCILGAKYQSQMCSRLRISMWITMDS